MEAVERIADFQMLQRTEEAIVVATGAPRERGCPPWVVLGVKAVEARGGDSSGPSTKVLYVEGTTSRRSQRSKQK